MKHLASICILLSLLAGSTRSWAQCNIPTPTSTPHYHALIDEMTGQPLASSATKCVVLIHGWNPGNAPNCYDLSDAFEFYELISNLKLKLKNTDWSIVAYDWHDDASTGYIGQEWNNPVIGAANQAAANAQLHGDHLATTLDNAASNLREVQFIAHSAGTHAAREAMIQLLQLNPYVIVQTTLLDPYIPCPSDSLGVFSDFEIDQLPFWNGGDRMIRLENYYANDDPLAGWNPSPWGNGGLNPFEWNFPTINTQERFYWRSSIDINQQIDWGTRTIGIPSYTPNYDWHAGPIQFYADTVDASISGHTPSSSLPAGSPYDYRNIGWNRSLYAWEQSYLPQITTQPADQTVQSGNSVTLNAVANRADTIDWYVFGGNWVGSGATLTINNFTAANPRVYVARIGNSNGELFTRPVTVTVSAASGPVVTSVSPSTFTGLPVGQRYPIRIIGFGFTGSSTLVFNDGVQNYNSNPAYLTFVSANEIDYNISTGTNQANWTVQVINGAPKSNLGHFTVNAPSTPPTATGSLVVNLSPAGAISAGAQWQVDGTGYNSSGQMVGYLTPGSHTVSFKPISGYTTPANQIVTINANAQTTASGTYSVIAPSTYTLTLNQGGGMGSISPSPLGTWNGSAYVYSAGSIVQLTASANPGYHFVGWGGDVSGTGNPVTITMSGNKSVTANFASGDPNMGTVVVTIQPPAAAAAGVTWGFSAGDYRASGSSYTTWPATYILTLHPVDGWLGSPSLVATITAGQTSSYVATFTADATPGLLTVTLSPPGAVTAGAKWHVNGGAAQGSGASLSLAPGGYTVTFDSVGGWAAPPSQAVTVLRSQTTVSSGNYTPPAGQPSIVSVQPNVGGLSGGTLLTISGFNFTAPATVLVGGQTASNVAVVSSGQITCLTPPNAIYGTAPIVVQSTGGSATNLNGFAYGFPRGTGIQLAGSIGGFINAMAGQGSYGYSGEGSTFTVFDVSNPAAPTPVARLAMPGLVQDIALFSAAGREYAAVANYDAGLQIVDVTTPAAPALRGYYNTGDYASGVAVLGTNAYVANGNSGLMIFDISNPSQPFRVGSLAIGSSDRLLVQTSGVNVFAYVSTGGALAVVDVSNRTTPVLRGMTAAITQSWETHSLALLSGRIFLADGYGYLQAIDVSNPSAPAALGSVSSDGPSAVATANGLIYTWGTLGLQIYNFPGGPVNRVGFSSASMALPQGSTFAVLGGIGLCTGGESGFRVYDVSTPSSPAYRGAYGATAGYYLAEAISGGNAFLATQNSGLKVINVNNPGAPALFSQYVPSFNGGFGGEKVQVYGNRAYFVSTHQINVLDVSNPQAPTLLGTNSTSQFLVDDLYIVGSSVVAAGFDTTTAPYTPALEVFDASSPSSIHMQSKLDFATHNGAAWAVAGNSSIACVAVPLASGSEFSLAVVNVSNLGSLQQLGLLPDIGVVSTMRLAPNNRYLYVGGQYSDLSWKIVDVANSSSPVLVSSNYIGAAVFGFDFSGTTAFLATGIGVQVYDVSNPAQPVLVRSYSTPAIPQDIRASGNNLFVADARGGLSVLALADLNPPEVFITSPTSSPVWTNATGTVNLAGTADDGLGLVQGVVTGVAWANNQGGGGNATGTTNWSVTGIALLPGTNVLTVTAFDGAGNSSNAILTAIYQTTNQNQTITFPAIADRTFCDPPIQLAAAASSGLPVVFSVVFGPATVSSSNVLTLTGAGAVTVEADQSGGSGFNPATPVDLSFNVAKANQSIAFTPVPGHSASDAPFALTATTSSSLPVYFDIVSGPATLSNNVVTMLGAGTVTMSAWQPGNSNYNAAATVQQSFTVGKVPQSITFGALSQQRAGDAPFMLNATASSGLPVDFSLVSGPATLSGNIVALTGWGTVTVSASQPGNNTYSAAPNVVQSFFVVPPNNTIGSEQLLPDGSFQLAFYGSAGQPYTLQASSNLMSWASVLTFVCTNSPTYVVDPGAKYLGRRFYRVAQGALPIMLRMNLSAPAVLSSNGLGLSLDAPIGFAYTIQASTNLRDWQALTNVLTTNAPMTFRDPGARSYGRRFYRAVVP